MDEWYYKRSDSEFGPVTDVELQGLLALEENPAGIQIRRNASEEWVYAAEAGLLPQRSPSVPPPLPPPVPVAAAPTPAVRMMAGPGGWLWSSVMLLAMNLIVLGFMQAVFAIYALFLLLGVTGLPDWFTQCVDALNSRVIWPQAATFVLLILWQGCAFGSLRRLYDDRRLEHGRGSGFWWITPVANLFMPFHCLRELHWASRKQRTTLETVANAGLVAWLIQTTIILNVICSVAHKIMTLSAASNPEAAESTVSTALNLTSNLTGVAQASFITLFVLRNLIHQIRLYRGWNPAAVVP